MSAFISTSSTKPIKNISWNNSSTKLSYFHNVGNKPLQYITIGTLLEEAATKFGDRKALISRHQKKFLTFSEALTQADKLAAAFKKIGLNKDDRVGLWAPNLLEWYVTKVACARAGLIAVGLNPAYEPPEIEFCINKVKIKAMVCGNKLRDHDYYENLLQIAPELEKSKPGKLISAKVPSLQSVIIFNDQHKNGTFSFNELLDLASSSEISSIQKSQNVIKPDDPAVIQFTSGTTGKPKAVLLSHFNLVNAGFNFGEFNELSQKHQTVCAPVPLFHIYGTSGTIMAGLHHGSTTVLPTDGYDSNKFFDAIKEERCTVIYGVPTMYVDLLEIQEKRQENIFPEIAIVGGALVAPELVRKMHEKLNFKKVKHIYGMTEASGVVFESPFQVDEEKALTTVGCLMDHMEAKVIDKNGEVVPFGTVGEVCYRGFSIMMGFWGDKEKTGEVLGKDGWLKSGDQFILQEDGYGKVVGRFKEIIIRGGENIAPREIEEYLFTHSDITDVHVIGIPHERLGEEVCACIRTKAGKKISLEDIVAFCKGKLAHFKIPSKIHVFDEFPKTTSGKVQKFKLQEMIIKTK